MHNFILFIVVECYYCYEEETTWSSMPVGRKSGNGKPDLEACHASPPNSNSTTKAWTKTRVCEEGKNKKY